MAAASTSDDFPFAPGEATTWPHYLALRDRIAQGIERGRLVPGVRLPSESRLQLGTGMVRGTIREALARLEAEGLIYRRDRMGWYVSPAAVTYDPTRWAGFMTYVAEQDRMPANKTLATQTVAATPATADIFRVTPGTPLYDIKRRRSIDARPAVIEHIMVDPALAPGLLAHSLDGSLTKILTQHYI